MKPPQSIVILGSTGSIGQQALEVARALPDRLRVVGLAAHSNAELLAQQIAEWQPAVAALFDEDAAVRLRSMVSGPTKVLSGAGGVEEVATWPQSTLVLGAMLGAAGLHPTLAAMREGKDIAIANKETLVVAGEIVVAQARQYGVTLLPVDSEHSAIAQCLVGENCCDIAKLTITASGGPFVDCSHDEIAQMPPERALKHPTWAMGRKITIDSATLMNKVLESIEAHWLFEVPMERIEIVVHRQSIVHSLVTFADNSVKAQMGVPDMMLPIQWALLHGERVPGSPPPLDLTSVGPLSFERPDEDRFPALKLARSVMEMGGTAPCAMNAANEVAVQAFLDGETGFYGITQVIEAVLERHQTIARPDLAAINQADHEARRHARELLGV